MRMWLDTRKAIDTESFIAIFHITLKFCTFDYELISTQNYMNRLSIGGRMNRSL